MKQSDLLSLGFTQNEAKIYLACLELGNGSAVQIAQKASLARSTSYDALRTLMQKGLITTFLKGSKKRFATSDPEVLKIRLQQQEEKLQRLLPELHALYVSKTTKPQLRFFEGKQGVNIVLKEALEEADEIISVCHIEDIFLKLDEYFPKFSQERAKRKIPIRIISRDCAMARERKKSGQSELRQIKIKQTPILFRSVFFAWKNKIALITLQEDLMIVLIESKDIAQTFHAMFEWIWNETSEIDMTPGD